jgi:hypothetical protein
LRPQLPDNYNELNPQDQQDVRNTYRREQVAWNELWIEWSAEIKRYNAQLAIWLKDNPGQQ